MNSTRPKKKRPFTFYLLLPIVFFLSAAICWVIVDHVFAIKLGAKFCPTIYEASIELGHVYIPTGEVQQPAFSPFISPDKGKYVPLPFKVRINSLRFRGAEPQPDDKSKLRIVCLGDSSTFGSAEAESDTYPAALENRLEENRPTRAYNLGVSGYSSLNGLVQFKKIATILEPNVVTISFGSNDSLDMLDRPALWRLPRRPDIEVFGETSKIGSWTKFVVTLEKYLSRALKNSTFFSWYNQRMITSRNRDVKPEKSGIPRATPEQYLDNIERIIAEAESRNAVSVVLAICLSPEYTKAAEKAAANRHVPFLDSRSLFKGTPEEFKAMPEFRGMVETLEKRFGPEGLKRYPDALFTYDTCHPNLLGYKLIGDALADKIDALLDSRK